MAPFYIMSNKPDSQRMERIVSLCKRRGFIFQAGEIYGGLNGVWDYGPLGVELKRNLKDYWWRVMTASEQLSWGTGPYSRESNG